MIYNRVYFILDLYMDLTNIIKQMAENYANKYVSEYMIEFLDRHPRLIRSYSRDIIETKLRNRIANWKYSEVQYNHTLVDALGKLKTHLTTKEIRNIFILTRQDLTDHLKHKARFYGRKFH